MPGGISQNTLAQAGWISNEAGRVFEPSWGPLELSWLFSVSKEARRKAKQALSAGQKVSNAERFSWFIASTESEFQGLRQIQQADWRQGLATWKSGSLYNVHNRATLHRLMFVSGRSEKPEAHLRECLRLYHQLSELAPKQPLYRQFQEDLISYLETSIEKDHQSGELDSVGRSLRLLQQTVGLVAVEHLQGKIFSKQLDTFRVRNAQLQKELLVYQGLAQAPPSELIRQIEDNLSQSLLPEAAQLSQHFLEQTQQRREVEVLTARLCGLLALSHEKGGDGRAAKRWKGEAMRWEPDAVKDWVRLQQEEYTPEPLPAQVLLPQAPVQQEHKPRNFGNVLLGLRAKPTLKIEGDNREEWLESVELFRLSIYPLRRFSAYRSHTEDAIAYFLPLPLRAWDYFRQVLIWAMFLFLVLTAALATYSAVKPKASPIQIVQVKDRMNAIVGKLKVLAEKESGLRSEANLSSADLETLKALESEREKLLAELAELEKKQ